MLRKNIAPVVATILSGLLFIIIGSCFSAFLYKDEVIKVNDPKVIISAGINVYDKNGETVEKLKLSQMKLGLKPATGEEDVESNIPVTVHDQNGSEGQFVKFQVLAPSGANIFVTNFVIESEKPKEEIEKEKENIMVAIKEIKKSATNVKGEKVSLGTLSASNDKISLTFYIWLSSKAAEILESSTISFDISFE